MRRIWLTLLIAVALAASSVAGAMAMQACPMVKAATAAAHDCCPDSDDGDDGDPQTVDGCLVGMACRSAAAIAPSLAPVASLHAPFLLIRTPLEEAAPAPGPLFEFFRPPR